jgi:hypothetical protein
LFDSRIWMKKKFFKIMIFSIFTVSFIIQIAAVSVYFQKYFQDLIFEKKENFIIMEGPEVLPLKQPPKDIYFDWKKSPILAQFTYIREFFSNMKNYKYSKPSEEATVEEKMKAYPFMHIFDFWWLNMYFLEGSYLGFIGAFFMFLITIYSSSRLLKYSTMNVDDNIALKKKSE